MKKILRLTCAVLALLLCLSALGCGKNKKVVLTVGGQEVTYDVFRYTYLNAKAQLDGGNEAYWQEDAEARRAELDALVEETLVNMYVVLALCEDYGVDPEGKALQKAVDEYYDHCEESYGKDFEKSLEERFLSKDVLRFLLTVDFAKDELFYALEEQGKILKTKEEIIEHAKTDAFIRVDKLLIVNDAGENPEDNRALAESVLAKARAGEDFSALISRYSEQIDTKGNPNGFYITRYEYVETFEKVAFALEVGEISDVIETEDGFCILRRLEKEDAYIEKHYAELRDTYQQAEFNRIIDAKKPSMTVAYTDYYNELDLASIR